MRTIGDVVGRREGMGNEAVHCGGCDALRTRGSVGRLAMRGKSVERGKY